jgi:hypothetical protein
MRRATLVLLVCACGGGDAVIDGGVEAGPDVVKDVVIDLNVPDLEAPDTGFQCKAISWWTADGTTADKLLFNDLSGVDGGTAVYAAGKYGQAFDFKNGPPLQAPFPNGFQSLQGLTVEGWVNVTGCTSDARIIDYQTPGKIDGWVFDVTSDQHLRAAVANASVKSVDTITAGTATHVAFTFDGKNFHVYIDGADEGSIGVLANVPWSSTPLRLGSSNSGTLPFCGTVDELMVYGRALPAAEVLAIHDNGPSARCSN